MKFVFIFVGLFLLAAIVWEYNDYKRVTKMTAVHELKTGKERLSQLKFISCFGYENAVKWRSLFITAVVITLCVGYVIPILLPNVIDKDKQLPFLMMLFFFAFLISYFAAGFRAFHFDRVLCSKVKKDMVVL